MFKPWGILLGDEVILKKPIKFPKLMVREKRKQKSRSLKK
jgi:hypothetical protein